MQTQRVKDDIRPLALKPYVWLYVYHGAITGLIYFLDVSYILHTIIYIKSFCNAYDVVGIPSCACGSMIHWGLNFLVWIEDHN